MQLMHKHMIHTLWKLLLKFIYTRCLKQQMLTRCTVEQMLLYSELKLIHQTAIWPFETHSQNHVCQNTRNVWIKTENRSKPKPNTMDTKASS